MITLRPYQEATADAVLAARQRGVGRALYVLPTGTGKTVTFSEIIRRVREVDNRPAMVLAHREELVVQARDTIRRLLPGVYSEIERANERASQMADVVVASLPTLAREGSQRLDWLARDGCSVIVYDEAHHAAAEGAGRVLSRFGAFDGRSFLVGCTATPHRLDNKPLEGAGGLATFEETVYSYPILDAIRDGWLCDLRGFVIRSEVSLQGVQTRGGDFIEGQLAKRVNDAARTEKAAQHWAELAGDRQTIVFCASVEHAQEAAAHWRAVGATAETVDGSMSRDERRAVIQRFRSGITTVLTNCQIATEGFDHPPTGCIVMLRPTRSWSLYAQMVGRGTRIFEGKKDCLILDVVDNCDEHSLVTAPRVLDLPAGVDLQGGSLREAREELDELGIRAAHLPKTPGRWRDLVTKAMEVPLFQAPKTPPELEKYGALKWLQLGTGYYLDLGSDGIPAGDATSPYPEGKLRRWVTLHEVSLGWQVNIFEEFVPKDSPRERVQKLSACQVLYELKFAVQWAEGYIKHNLGSIYGRSSRNASYNSHPPTEAQMALIAKLARSSRHREAMKDYDPSQIRTKGEAGALISQLLSKERLAA